jgi:hypothetical protein
VAKLSHHWNDFHAFAIIPKSRPLVPLLWLRKIWRANGVFFFRPAAFWYPNGSRRGAALCGGNWAGCELARSSPEEARIDSAAKYRPPEDDPHIPDLRARRGHAANQ